MATPPGPIRTYAEAYVGQRKWAKLIGPMGIDKNMKCSYNYPFIALIELY